MSGGRKGKEEANAGAKAFNLSGEPTEGGGLVYHEDPDRNRLVRVVLEGPEEERLGALQALLFFEYWDGVLAAEEVKALARAMVPDAERGVGILRAARAGGKRRKGQTKGPADSELRRELEELIAKGETLTNARRRLAEQHGLGLTTVRRRTPRE